LETKLNTKPSPNGYISSSGCAGTDANDSVVALEKAGEAMEEDSDLAAVL